MNSLEDNPQPKQIQKQTKSNVTCQWILFITINIMILSMLGYCLINKNVQNMLILNFPADSQGKICNIDFKHNFSYLYIDFNGPKVSYRCVNQCPNEFNDYMIIDSNSQSFFSAYSQEPNTRLGNICWSQNKQKIINSMGLNEQINYKQTLLTKFSSILTLVVVSFFIGFISFLFFYFLFLRLNYYLAIVLAFAMLVLYSDFIFTSQVVQNKVIYQILIAATLIVLITSVLFGAKKLDQSISFTQKIMESIKGGQQSSAKRMFRFIVDIIIFSIINGLLLVFILTQYICLVSSDSLVKEESHIYYTVEKTWWKYIVLGFQWLFLSNLIFDIYSLIVVKNAYSVINNKTISCAKISWNSLLNIYGLAFLQTVFWVPLHLILLIKPQGAIIKQDEEKSCCAHFTTASYCCCGAIINWLHKYTFNPFFVLIVGSSFDDLSSSLAVVQNIYHRKDPKYDRSSLWLYRLCTYINIATFSIMVMKLLSSSEGKLWGQDYVFLFFDIIAVIVSVQVTQYWLCFWSTLTEVSQFMQACKQNITK